MKTLPSSTPTNTGAATRVSAPTGPVRVIRWWVPDAQSGRAEIARLAEADRTLNATGAQSSSKFYLSVEGTTAMAYLDDDAHLHPTLIPRGCDATHLVGFTRSRSIVLDPEQSPSAIVVVASFDVDGPERQEALVDLMSTRVTSSRAEDQEGLVSVNFHLSTDGSRVLNFAEWTTDEAHEKFLTSASRHTNLQASTATPGIRPIGFTRYHLVRGA